MASGRSTTTARKTAAKKTPPAKTAAAVPAPATADAPARKAAAAKKALVVPEITTEIVDVTPEMATRWLEGNFTNRKLNERTVKLYARDMEAGRWLLNGEAVQLAVDGTLLNGQHRLHAIILSGLTIKMLVVSNLPLSAQKTMDAGRRRTNHDNLLLEGRSNAKALAAIARKVALWQRGDRAFKDVVSFGEISDLLTAHPEIVRSAEIGERVHRAFKPLSVSVLGTAHFLMHQKSPQDTPWFFGAIESGAGLEEGNPVLTLRERVRNDKDNSVSVSDVRALGYIVRAWNATREGRTLTYILHPAGTPVPPIV